MDKERWVSALWNLTLSNNTERRCFVISLTPLSLSFLLLVWLSLYTHTHTLSAFFLSFHLLLVYFTVLSFFPLTCPCLTTSVCLLLLLHRTTHDESGRKYGTCASQTKSSPITSILFSSSLHLMLASSTRHAITTKGGYTHRYTSHASTLLCITLHFLLLFVTKHGYRNNYSILNEIQCV